MAVFFKTKERAPTTPISISPTGATMGQAAHLLVWGKCGNTYAHDPAFYSLLYYNGNRWNSLPSFPALKWAIPCITPNMYPSWDNFNIENFVMGNDSGFGIGTRYAARQNACKISYGNLTDFDVNTSQKLLIFINKSGFTYSDPSTNNIANPPSFINDYLNYYKYTESIYYNRWNQETMFPSYFITSNPEYKLKDLTNYDLLAAGTYHFMMGYGNTLYAWGENSNNQCNIPANATSTINLKQITAGNAHSLALYYTANKGSTIIGWGSNSNGQITIPSSIGTGAIQIASGFDHNLALSATGGVICWGNNSYNQCNVPVGLSGITFIAAGHYHSMAIKSDGTVYCWGLNTSGQCDIPNGTTNGFRIDGGLEHTVLLKKDGTVTAWGGNTFYQTTLPDCPGKTLFNNNAYAELDSGYKNNWAVNIPNSVRDIRCGKYSSIALHTGIRMWYHKIVAGLDFSSTGERILLYQSVSSNDMWYIRGLPNNSNLPGSTATHVTTLPLNSKRYDLYDYDDTIPIYPPNENIPYSESIGYRWPIKRNGSFYNTSAYGYLQGGTAGNTGCWSFGYGDDGIFKSYDWFAPPDFSGVGLRARRCSNSNLFWDWTSGQPFFGKYGKGIFGDYFSDYGYGSDFNFYNSGGIPCLLISKKHFVVCQHWAYPSTYWEQQFMRRDNKTFNVAGNLLTRISNGIGEFPDLMLFEMQTELSADDAKNVAIYNKWADYSGFTGTQMIDPQAVVLKGITAGITSGSAQITSAIGRRMWAIDANDRAYGARVRNVGRNLNATNKGYYLNLIEASPNAYEPLNCSTVNYVGDSGTPWFITGRGHTYHASYDESLGITLQPTIFLGINTFARTPQYLQNTDISYNSFFDYGITFDNINNPQFLTKSPIQIINEYLIAAGQQPIEKIPIDVGNPPWPPYIIPVAGACADPNEIVTSLNIDPNGLFSSFINAPTGNEIIGSASVESVNGNILTLSGISGTFIISDNRNSYSILGGTAGASYNKINPFTTPINNGLGTTAGSADALNNEAAGYTFDSNDPFEIFNG
jgi:hypothetical protein